jgi:hypothetical protein
MEEEIKDSKINIVEYAKSLVKRSVYQEEKNFIFVGNSCSGKTAIFNLLFSNKKEKPNYTYNQTCGINFNNANVYFSNSRKVILNGYELGGGVESFPLIKNIVYQENYDNSAFILVVDLSKPEQFLTLFNNFNKQLYDMFINENENKDDNKNNNKNLKNNSIDILTRNAIIKEKESKVKTSSDLKYLNLQPWRAVIVGTKYDLFEKFDL